MSTHDQQSSCEGKQRHPSLAAAMGNRRRQRFLTPYRCRWCRCWHLSGSGWERRMRLDYLRRRQASQEEDLSSE